MGKIDVEKLKKIFEKPIVLKNSGLSSFNSI